MSFDISVFQALDPGKPVQDFFPGRRPEIYFDPAFEIKKLIRLNNVFFLQYLHNIIH